MYCPSCGEEIADYSDFCRYCGENLDHEIEPEPEPAARPVASRSEPERSTESRSHQDTETGEKRWVDEYSTAVWVVSVIAALITFPIGLVVPAYLYFKASKNSSVDQTSLEIWTVVLWGIFGIAAVEIGGKKGAKVLWGILGAIIALFILIIIAAAI